MTKPLIHTEAICSHYTECYCGCILCDVACRGLMPGQEEPFSEDPGLYDPNFDYGEED